MANEVLTNGTSSGAGAAAAAATLQPSGEPNGSPPPPPKEEVDLSRGFAALTRRERAIIEREKALKEAQKARETDPEWSAFQQYKKVKDQAKVDPLAYLQAAGLTYEQVSEYLLNDKKLTAEQRVALLEEKLNEDRAEKAREAEEKTNRDVDETLERHKQSIAAFVAADQDTFELINKHGEDGVDLVYQVVLNYFEEHGQVLPIDAAAKHVEDWLVTKSREILSAKKFQPKPAGETAPEASSPTTQTPAQPIAPTLTNRAVAAAPPVGDGRLLSKDESIRKAAAMLRWS